MIYCFEILPPGVFRKHDTTRRVGRAWMKGFVFRAAIPIFLFLMAALNAAHALDMAEGEWEIVSETSIESKGFSMPPQASRVTQCLTREDALPSQEKECKVTSRKMVGNTISWSVQCGKSEGEGEITYHASGKSYKGNFRMKSVEDGETVTMRMTLSGKHLGPCPPGQKSGFTGEMAARQAQAEKAMATAKQVQAEQEALRKKCEDFVQRTVVPADPPESCGQEGVRRNAKCEKMVGKLDMEFGRYEITVEQASRIGPSCTLTEEKRKAVCMNMDDPVPPELLVGRQVRQVKRGKDRITWSDSSAGMETKGGIVFRGNSFEGVVTRKSSGNAGMEQLQVTKVTGRRAGPGDCPKERDASAVGREYTAQERPGDSATDVLKGVGENPAKGIRKLFGF